MKPMALCTNLDNEPEKLLRTFREMTKWGIVPERVPGVVDHNPKRGSALVKIRAVELARSRGWKEFLLIEDDVLLYCDYEEFEASRSRLPDDWDIFVTGASFLELADPRCMAGHYRYKRFSGLQCTLIRDTAYSDLINKVWTDDNRACFDQSIGIRTDLVIYGPPLGKGLSGQYPGWSNVRGEHVDWTGRFRRKE